MKKFTKISLILLCVVFVAAVSGYIYLQKEYPKVDKAPEIKIDPTPELISRGNYLFNNVAACVDCHSKRDFSKLSAPVIPGTEGMGGLEIGEELGAPGTFYTKNITPAGVGDWTDGELFRAITEGVSKDGEPLFPMMPYLEYGKMDKEDIYSIIAYMRTLKPIQNEVPKSKANFPVNLLMRTMPVKSDFKTKPNGLDKIASGKYLVEIAGCKHCHTPNENGEYDINMLMAGGQEMMMPGNNILRSSNITPDAETGIGLWSKEVFINRFKSALETSFKNTYVKQDEFNTIMPWTVYAGISEEDLGNIYEYLKSLKPVRNQVEKFTVNKY